jgi:hypothetical protein
MKDHYQTTVEMRGLAKNFRSNAGVGIPELRDLCPAVCLKINAV